MSVSDLFFFFKSSMCVAFCVDSAKCFFIIDKAIREKTRTHSAMITSIEGRVILSFCFIDVSKVSMF